MKPNEIEWNEMNRKTRNRRVISLGVLSIATTENQEVEGLYSFSFTNSNNHLLVLIFLFNDFLKCWLRHAFSWPSLGAASQSLCRHHWINTLRQQMKLAHQETREPCEIGRAVISRACLGHHLRGSMPRVASGSAKYNSNSSCGWLCLAVAGSATGSGLRETIRYGVDFVTCNFDAPRPAELSQSGEGWGEGSILLSLKSGRERSDRVPRTALSGRDAAWL